MSTVPKKASPRRKFVSITDELKRYLEMTSRERGNYVGGLHRWRKRNEGEGPLHKELVKLITKRWEAGQKKHNINGHLVNHFCGEGMPGYKNYSRATVRKVTAGVIAFLEQEKKQDS